MQNESSIREISLEQSELLGIDLSSVKVCKIIRRIALVTFVQSLRITDEQRKDLISLLNEKYSVTSIKGINTILQRISDTMNYSRSDTSGEMNLF